MEEFYCSKINGFVEVSTGRRVTAEAPDRSWYYLDTCLQSKRCGVKLSSKGQFAEPSECPVYLEVFYRNLASS